MTSCANEELSFQPSRVVGLDINLDLLDCLEGKMANFKIETNIKWLKIMENISLSEEDILGAKVSRETVQHCELTPANNP